MAVVLNLAPLGAKLEAPCATFVRLQAQTAPWKRRAIGNRIVPLFRAQAQLGSNRRLEISRAKRFLGRRIGMRRRVFLT